MKSARAGGAAEAGLPVSSFFRSPRDAMLQSRLTFPPLPINVQAGGARARILLWGQSGVVVPRMLVWDS